MPFAYCLAKNSWRGAAVWSGEWKAMRASTVKGGAAGSGGRGAARGTRGPAVTREFFAQEPLVDPRPPLPDAPAFTIDDLIDFHFTLQNDASLHEFLAKH